ncbi:hypothetical protein C8R43DRAFT_955873 [Mycena crocata]|nr:hypothetical protein C8R43DRAFT_955873 [Mycena crocata]
MLDTTDRARRRIRHNDVGDACRPPARRTTGGTTRELQEYDGFICEVASGHVQSSPPSRDDMRAACVSSGRASLERRSRRGTVSCSWREITLGDTVLFAPMLASRPYPNLQRLAPWIHRCFFLLVSDYDVAQRVALAAYGGERMSVGWGEDPAYPLSVWLRLVMMQMARDSVVRAAVIFSCRSPGRKIGHDKAGMRTREGPWMLDRGKVYRRARLGIVVDTWRAGAAGGDVMFGRIWREEGAEEVPVLGSRVNSARWQSTPIASSLTGCRRSPAPPWGVMTPTPWINHGWSALRYRCAPSMLRRCELGLENIRLKSVWNILCRALRQTETDQSP